MDKFTRLAVIGIAAHLISMVLFVVFVALSLPEAIALFLLFCVAGFGLAALTLSVIANIFR